MSVVCGLPENTFKHKHLLTKQEYLVNDKFYQTVTLDCAHSSTVGINNMLIFVVLELPVRKGNSHVIFFFAMDVENKKN
jgi:hypothetical protein